MSWHDFIPKVNVGRVAASAVIDPSNRQEGQLVVEDGSFTAFQLGVFTDLSPPFSCTETSDRMELSGQLSEQQRQNGLYHISFARMAAFGPLCRVVAWNLAAGSHRGEICIYQRVAAAAASGTKMPTRTDWILVASVSTNAINSSPQSSRALISDLAPVFYRTKSGHMQAILILSRLGGSVEIVQLPPDFWTAALNAQIATGQNSKRRRRQSLASIPLASLSSDNLPHMREVLCLSTFQQTAYSDRITLMVSGTSHLSRRTVVNVWTLVPESQRLSVIYLSQFEISSCGPDISSTHRIPVPVDGNTTWAGNTQTLCGAITNISAPTLQLTVSFDGSYLACVDFNGGVTIFACNNWRSKSFRAYQMYDRIQMMASEYADTVIQAMWFNSAHLATVTSAGNLRLHNLEDGKLVLSRKCGAASLLGSKYHGFISALHGLGFGVKPSLMLIEKLRPSSAVDRMIAKRQVAEAHMMVVKYDIRDDTTLKSLWDVYVSTDAITKEPEKVKHVTETIIGRIKDDEFVISTALDVHIKYADALEVILDEAIERAKQQNKIATYEILMHRRAKLITYVYLCSKWNVNFSIKAFIGKFMNLSLIDLACSCASRCDIQSVLLLFLRHGNEVLSSRLQILGCIPPHCDPSLYEYLLPVVPSKFYLDNCSSEIVKFFFKIEANAVQPSTFTEMVANFQQMLPHDKLFHDYLTIVSKQCDGTLSGTEQQLNEEKMAAWYVSRALYIEKVSGQMHVALTICEKGSSRLLRDKEGGTIGPNLLSLSSLRSTISFLLKCVYGGVLPVNFSLADWNELGIEGFVHLLFGENDSIAIFSRWKSYISPLLENTSISLWGLHDNVILSDVALRSIHEYCVKRCAAEGISGLRVCSVFANASRPSLKRRRILESDMSLIRFVLECIYTSQDDHLGQHLDLLWDLFESLPARGIENRKMDDSSDDLHNRVDMLRGHLIATEICSKYVPPHNLGALMEVEEQESRKRGEFWCTIVDQMSDALCKRVMHQPRNNWSSHFMQLVVDVSELRMHVFDQLPLGYTERGIARFLLTKQQFLLVENILNMNKSPLLYEIFKEATVAFIQEALDNSTVYHHPDLPIAIQCRQRLAPSFPELSAFFEREAKLIAAADLALSLKSSLPLRNFRIRSALEIIDAVLVENPQAGIHGTDWGVAEFAEHENRMILQYAEQQETDNLSCVLLPGAFVLQLLDLMGTNSTNDVMAATCCIAQALLNCGMHGPSSALCYTTLFNLSDAFDQYALQECDLISTIAMIISAEEYTDLRMKLGLCSLTLSRLNVFMEMEDIDSTLHTLFKCYSRLELQYLEFVIRQSRSESKLDEEVVGVPPNVENGGFLVFRAVSMVARGAQSIVQQAHGPSTHWISSPKRSSVLDLSYEQQREHEIQLSLHQLSLREAALRAAACEVTLEEFEVDKDSHVVTLARETIISCVRESTLIRDPANEVAFDSMSMIQLGVSFLLDIVDVDCSSSILNEMQCLLEEKAAESLEQLANSAQSEFVVPDEEIVRQLCTYGFNVNGARRSAVAMHNISCAKALEWAMQHERDADFDLPLIHQNRIDDSEGRVVDQVAIQNVRNAFRFASLKLQEKAELNTGDSKASYILPPKQQSTMIETSKTSDRVPAESPDDDFGWDDDSFDLEDESVGEGEHTDRGIICDNPENANANAFGSEMPSNGDAESVPTRAIDNNIVPSEQLGEGGGWDGDSFDLNSFEGTNENTSTSSVEKVPDSSNDSNSRFSMVVNGTMAVPPPPATVQRSCEREANIQDMRCQPQTLASPKCLDKIERQRLALEGRKLLQVSRSEKISSPSRSPSKAELTLASRKKLIEDARKLLDARKQASSPSKPTTTVPNGDGEITTSYVDVIQVSAGTRPKSSQTLEDRKRLALEGRRMLEQARKSKDQISRS